MSDSKARAKSTKSGGVDSDTPAAPPNPPPDAGKLDTRIVRRRLRDLKILPVEENARFMEGAEFKLLVENLRIDGVLTSAPLVDLADNVLSGNHRVEAALAAGIEEADVIQVTSELTPERALAIQLSHNAIVGKDDPARAARLYSKLDLTWKRFSGLTDSMFAGMKEINIKALAIGAPVYQELTALFLPEQATIFMDAMAKVERLAKKSGLALAGRFEDFDRVFDAVVTAKRVRGIHNTAVALRTIAEVALEHLQAEEVEETAAKVAHDPTAPNGAVEEAEA